jgi:hypothetical protein
MRLVILWSIWQNLGFSWGGVREFRHEFSRIVDEWGDNLVIALLAAVFEKPIVVVTARTLRTFGPTGESEGTPKTMDAVWVAYNEIDHYYNVVNIADRVCSRAQILISRVLCKAASFEP